MTRFLNIFSIAILSLSVVTAQDVDPLTSNQWVQPSEAGEFSGRIIVPSGDGMARAVEGASVTIASLDGGGVTGQAVTDGMGEFTISGVTPGVYVISSRAANAYSHSAIHVIDSSVDLGGRYPNVAEISAANMNYDAVSTTINRYRPPSNRRVITMADADLDALADGVINGETYRVSQFDGGLNGRLYGAGAEGPNLIPAAMTNVFIMKNGVEVGRSVTNELGDFRIDNLPTGSYSLLAIGREGMAAIGFEVVEQGANVAQVTADGKRFVATTKATSSFGCQLGGFADDGDGDGAGDGGDGLPDPVGLPAPFGGYGTPTYPTQGAYASTGGGGGGAVGGSGVGGIAGLAGIAGIIAAASNGGGSNPSVVPPPTASEVLPSNGPNQFDLDGNGIPDNFDFDNFPDTNF